MTKNETLEISLITIKMALDLQENTFIDFKKYGLKEDEDIEVKYRQAIRFIELSLSVSNKDETEQTSVTPFYSRFLVTA